MLSYVLGFLFRDQVVLHLLVLAGAGFHIAYNFLHPAEPLWGAIYANMLIGGANLVGPGRIVYGRMKVGIDDMRIPNAGPSF